MPSAVSKQRKWLLVCLGVATVLGFVILGSFDTTMHDAGGPGIARFEVAMDHVTAARILDEWGVEGKDAAKKSLYFDFLFLLIYGAFLVVAIRTLARSLAARGKSNLAWLGSWIWWWAVIGAAFDVIEDIALLMIVNGNTAKITPTLAAYFAVLKFVFLVNAVLYLIAGSISLWRAGRTPAPAA